MLSMRARSWLTHGVGSRVLGLVKSGSKCWPVPTVAVAAAITLLVGGACGANSPSSVRSEATPSSNDKFVIRSLPWEVVTVVEPRTVVIVLGAGSCSGKPHILQTRSRYKGDSVYIQVEVAFPKVKWRKGVICGGTELFLRRSVKLRRDVDDVRLFDTSANPPILRWPS